MAEPAAQKPMGILNPRAGERQFALGRYAPSPDVGYFVETYWTVAWDLRGREPHVQETLPHPSVHLVFEDGGPRVYGIDRGKFARVLEGTGRVFAVKFRPGGFYPFVNVPVSRFRGGPRSLREVLGVDGRGLQEAILSCGDEARMVALAEGFVRERLPERDETVDVVAGIVGRIMEDRTITKVDDVTARMGVNKRWLQRVFSRYVGVSPKWVIRRYRLHEAADLLAEGGEVDWPQVALDLGYFDQAHFIKDFKGLVGVPPAEYARRVEASA
ncbi:MAG TPA: helix-turn-helix domain-containing protein [Rhodothermales bacterium]|nr:helix-turn-helix domain-containing protein [Rhodothermales bacterium]